MLLKMHEDTCALLSLIQQHFSLFFGPWIITILNVYTFTILASHPAPHWIIPHYQNFFKAQIWCMRIQQKKVCHVDQKMYATNKFHFRTTAKYIRKRTFLLGASCACRKGEVRLSTVNVLIHYLMVFRVCTSHLHCTLPLCLRTASL